MQEAMPESAVSRVNNLVLVSEKEGDVNADFKTDDFGGSNSRLQNANDSACSRWGGRRGVIIVELAAVVI